MSVKCVPIETGLTLMAAPRAVHHCDLSEHRCSPLPLFAKRAPHKATFDQQQREKEGRDGEIATERRG